MRRMVNYSVAVLLETLGFLSVGILVTTFTKVAGALGASLLMPGNEESLLNVGFCLWALVAGRYLYRKGGKACLIGSIVCLLYVTIWVMAYVDALMMCPSFSGELTLLGVVGILAACYAARYAWIKQCAGWDKYIPNFALTAEVEACFIFELLECDLSLLMIIMFFSGIVLTFTPALQVVMYVAVILVAIFGLFLFPWIGSNLAVMVIKRTYGAGKRCK